MIVRKWLALMAPLLIAAAPPATPETRAAALFDRLRGDLPAQRIFLQAMPKGADLHNHLGGSTYAEDFLAWADSLDLCVAADGSAILPPPCRAPASQPARGLARRDPALYGRAVDGLSMRGVDPVAGRDVTGHDRFFATFDRFAAAAGASWPAMIAAARESAALDNVRYLELMVVPPAVRAVALPVAALPATPADLPALSERLAPLMPAAVAEARAHLDAAEAEAARIGRCPAAPAAGGCDVAVRYLVSALRNQPPAVVFAQLAFGFAVAEADPRFVGINLVAPEDGPVARGDYALHMAMVGWLAARHPRVGIALHAGELVLGLVPPRDLADHIAQAVTVAGARRIGHGVDIAHERDAAALLARMARERIAVEINLTSNDLILGVTGPSHPLNLYRRAGVPVTLSTDDQGVARGDLTAEYLRAATEQGLDYRALKAISRAGLEHAFVAGASLWRDAGAAVPVAACPLGREPAPACRAFLDASPRAALQWRLEADLARFEAGSGEMARALGR